MLKKDLLRVSRAGDGYQPQFTDDRDRETAARVIGVYQGHVGESRESLQGALSDLERAASDFKLVRGFAKLLDRDATFETHAPLPPARTRRVAFEAAEAVGVVTTADRQQAIEQAADRLGADPEAVETSLYADLDDRQVLASLDRRWTPSELLVQYDLSLAQTALFDATEVRVRSSDPRRLIDAVKRLRLLYEVVHTDPGRELVVTGPDALFENTRRYGTRFARLLRTVAGTESWQVTATIDDDGTERTMTLSDVDLPVPDAEPVVEMSFDSGVEADFATRLQSLDLPWALVREPEPLEAGTSVAIPDFAFDYRYAEFRVFFEIMGFWTPEYVQKKLDQFEAIDDAELLVAYDESLGVGDAIEARNQRAIPYSKTVSLKAVRDALRRYEADLVNEAATALPDELTPQSDVITLTALADDHAVSEDAIERATFPDHERVGRTLIRPAVLEALEQEIADGMTLDDAEAAFEAYGIDDASAVLSRLGYRVEWDGLSGGTVRKTA
ncbi:DUF790 family protein [Halorhabdus sp. CBA1104]|uniref:DUF790 family protein n=1 Tax=Halorhabdus sp. CBA1104 TaxID=1380432 RepID=UPI0012B1D15F|nr:DUF790 family protein [Halorhabdus sp. CBA1104]QGN06824.1 DUF790 family protein [Halorhabdus sp. CBA1104]